MNASYISNWTLYPFPVPDAKANVPSLYQQQIQCVTSGASEWTFHFDSGNYTLGCLTPPKTFDDPCDSLMFEAISNTVGTLATVHGAFVACSEIGSMLVVAANGSLYTDVVLQTKGESAPGLLVCDAGMPIASNHPAVKTRCGLGSGPALLAPWKFVALPVASGPLNSVTTNVPGGTICLNVGARSFTYSATTGSVTEGCG